MELDVCFLKHEDMPPKTILEFWIKKIMMPEQSDPPKLLQD
jgi:hypothetical protein